MPEKARRSSFFHLILRNDREKMITPSQLATMLRIVSMMSTVFPTPAPPDVELLQDLDIHRFSAPCSGFPSRDGALTDVIAPCRD